MAISGFVLGRRYRASHVIGAVVCMVGVIVNILSDYESPDPDAFPFKGLGDILAISGGLLYGLQAVLAEMAVKEFGGSTEYVAVLGVFGTLISLVQVLILEKYALSEYFGPPPEENHGGFKLDIDDAEKRASCSSNYTLFLLFLYVAANYISYVGVSRFLLVSESAMLKLSLLTSDLWAVLFTVFAEHIIPHPLFWLSLILILSGVFIYEIAPSPMELLIHHGFASEFDVDRTHAAETNTMISPSSSSKNGPKHGHSTNGAVDAITADLEDLELTEDSMDRLTIL